MKHTQGTWYARDGQIYPEETGKTLAVIPYYDKDNAQQKADANLIAAAPELLEELKKAHRFLRKGGYLMDSINMAIAKAEGINHE